MSQDPNQNTPSPDREGETASSTSQAKNFVDFGKLARYDKLEDITDINDVITKDKINRENKKLDHDLNMEKLTFIGIIAVLFVGLLLVLKGPKEQHTLGAGLMGSSAGAFANRFSGTGRRSDP
jgi:hypothetical protein